MRHARLMVQVLAAAMMLSPFGYLQPELAHAYGGAHACPGGTSDWQGTQLGPSAPVVVTGDAAITCPTPQVTVTAGSTEHRSTSSPPPPQNGQPCYKYEDSSVAMGPVVNSQRQISWYEPTNQAMTTVTIPDEPFAGIPGYIPTQASVLYASLIMGSANMTLHYELDGTWSTATQSCQGGWTIPANGGTDYGYPIAAVTRRGALPYVTPPSINVEQVVATATAKFRQVYTGGQVASSPPGGSQIVHYPSCFTEQGANVPATVGFSIRDPQPGTGAVLVVNFVAQATIDQVWWDFAEPQNPVTVQQGTNPAAPCSVQHTYAHVSADAYGSNHGHHPPPGVAWTFGDAEPAADMEAVEVWQHVHFSVTAYYQEPDGSQFAQQLAVNNAVDDFWLAATPEWVRVYQIEGVPDTQ
jgi:hypothetical protein